MANQRKRIRKVSKKQQKINRELAVIRLHRWMNGPRLCMLTIPPHPIFDFEDFTLDHRIPGKMGRGMKDNNEANLQDACAYHNNLKGSQRDFKPIRL